MRFGPPYKTHISTPETRMDPHITVHFRVQRMFWGTPATGSESLLAGSQRLLKVLREHLSYLCLVGNGRMVVIVVICVPHSSIREHL